MANDRAAQIARIKQIERIKELEGKRAPEMNAEPGIEGMGQPDGPTAAAEAKQPLSEKIDAALSGLSQGVTMGYAPQISAAIQPGTDWVMDKLSGGYFSDQDKRMKELGIKNPEETYLSRRDAEIARHAELSRKNPYLYGGGQLAGTVATGLAMPGGAALKGGTTAAKTLAAARTGAILGMAQNPGDVEGEINVLQAPERIMNAGVGMGMGAGTTFGLEATSKYAAPLLKKLAAKAGFRSLGPYAKAARAAVGKDEVEKIGDAAIDSGVIGPVPRGYEKIAERAEEASLKAGKNLENYMDDLAAKEGEIIRADKSALERPEGPLSRRNIAKKVREDVVSEHTDVPGVPQSNASRSSAIKTFEKPGVPEGPPLVDQYGNKITHELPPDRLNMKEAWTKRKEVGKQVNWLREKGADIPDTEVVNRNLYGKLSQGMEEEAAIIENAAQGAPGKVKSGEFKKLNDKTHLLRLAKDIAGRRESHELAKQAMLPAAGAAYGAFHGGADQDITDRIQDAITYGLGGAALRKGMQMSPQVMAYYGSKLAKGAAKVRAPSNPWLVPNLVKGVRYGEEKGEE